MDRPWGLPVRVTLEQTTFTTFTNRRLECDPPEDHSPNVIGQMPFSEYHPHPTGRIGGYPLNTAYCDHLLWSSDVVVCCDRLLWSPTVITVCDLQMQLECRPIALRIEWRKHNGDVRVNWVIIFSEQKRSKNKERSALQRVTILSAGRHLPGLQGSCLWPAQQWTSSAIAHHWWVIRSLQAPLTRHTRWSQVMIIGLHDGSN